MAGGKQCFSWIHVGDLVKAFSYAIEHPEMQGVFNLTSPNPVTQAQFGKTLASLLHRPFLLPLFKWQIKLLFGEGSQVLTQGASVVPKKLLKLGFQFDYAESRLALKDIIYNKKSKSESVFIFVFFFAFFTCPSFFFINYYYF